MFCQTHLYKVKSVHILPDPSPVLGTGDAARPFPEDTLCLALL